MKKYIFKDFESFTKNDKGDIICPTGNYSVVKEIPDNCIFDDNCIFGDNCNFGEECVFGFECVFGDNCSFGKGCFFDCWCIFGADCKFSEYCSFGEECGFGKRCVFGGGCKFCITDKDEQIDEILEKGTNTDEIKVIRHKDHTLKTIERCGRKEYMLDGTLIDRFALLAIASDCESKEKAQEIANVARLLFLGSGDWVFDELYIAVREHNCSRFHRDEFYYQRLFERVYAKIRRGKVVKNKTDGRNIPDAWVERDGYIIPVEVKLRDFNDKALAQLKRYMERYGSESGIAVAKKLTTDLPPNIEFISFEELEAAEKQCNY